MAFIFCVRACAHIIAWMSVSVWGCFLLFGGGGVGVMSCHNLTWRSVKDTSPFIMVLVYNISKEISAAKAGGLNLRGNFSSTIEVKGEI